MEHAILPCSSAGIWGKPGGCTGWPMMAQAFPELEDSVDSLEGDASHEIAEGLVNDAKTGSPNPRNTAADWEGKTSAKGVVFTEEMFDGAKIYADDIKAVMLERQVFGGPALRVEQRVEVPKVHAHNWGTPDCALYDEKKATLYIWDYKFGRVVVEAFENWQAMNYAAGLFSELGIDGHLDQFTRVKIRIVQPRAYHREGVIREWSFVASDLRGHINSLKFNAEEAMGPNAKFRTGPHCQHCPGRHACPPALKAGLSMFEATGIPIPVELPPEAVGVQLAIIKRARKQLEFLESGFEEQVKGLLRAGKSVPGWCMSGAGVGKPKWSKPVGEVLMLGDMMSVDLRKPAEAVTPIQAGKLGIDAAVITAYSTKPPTAAKLESDDGSRARQIFNTPIRENKR